MSKTENLIYKKKETISNFYNFFLKLDSEDSLTFLIKFLNLIENPYGNFGHILYQEYINQQRDLEKMIKDVSHSDYVDIKTIINGVHWASAEMGSKPFQYFHKIFYDLNDNVISAMKKILNPSLDIEDNFIPINI